MLGNHQHYHPTPQTVSLSTPHPPSHPGLIPSLILPTNKKKLIGGKIRKGHHGTLQLVLLELRGPGGGSLELARIIDQGIGEKARLALAGYPSSS
ncbi:hypothetical protein B0O99DRAFT_617327 [Bisporella sp. PMI_857]|nr:hypothetical protein B0O99DRAFT_617327 [Bisporella sp. PMI_857]